MARKQAVEVQCSRCARTEYQEGTLPGPSAVVEPAFVAKMPSAPPLVWEDLCTPCLRSVKALVEQIGKKIEGLSPDRAAKADKPERTETVASPAEKKPEAKKEAQTHTGSTPHAHAPVVAAVKNPAAVRSS